MIKSSKPVVSVCAVRTGCGKSQTTRRVSQILIGMGKKVAAIRHPMPYGDLVTQKVQKFVTKADLVKHKCTIEEMEEYEPHIENGVIVFAGVDYGAILREAEKVADIILWDGGNNDFPFYKSDLEIVVADPHRAGHEREYYPGRGQLPPRRCHRHQQDRHRRPGKHPGSRENIRELNPKAIVVDAASPAAGQGRREDPRQAGAGHRGRPDPDPRRNAVRRRCHGRREIRRRRTGRSRAHTPWARIAETFKKYPDIGVLLPAMGYGAKQMKDLEATINKVDCDLIIIATPIDLGRIVKFKKPTVRVGYELQEIGTADPGRNPEKEIQEEIDAAAAGKGRPLVTGAAARLYLG